MIAGSDISNGAASSLTDRSGSAASRITKARRVGSDSAAKVRSSASFESLTMWFSIERRAAESTGVAAGGCGLAITPWHTMVIAS
jgi:hypothetical protein